MTASERHLRAESKWPSLPPEAWPPRHKEAWDEACRRDSPIRRGGRAASLAPATRRGMTQTYGQFVRWLRDTCNLDQQADPASQMARDLLAEFVAERRKAVRDSVIYGNLRTLKMMMNCLAPGCDWNWIPRQTGGPSLQEARVTRRHRQLFPPGQLLHRLVIAMQKAMQIPVDRVRRDRIRNCLMVALAVISGLRLRNVAFMRLGRNLIERKAGWDIMFDADEVKNDAAILCHVPALFSPFIERYLTVDRPRTIAKRGVDTDAVWVSPRRLRRGLSSGNIAWVFGQIGTEMLGYPITSHSVRHVEATRILENDPRALETASLALAHTNLRAVCEFYDQSGPRAAQMVWLELVADMQSTERKRRARETERGE
jgi:hypothetical protein